MFDRGKKKYAYVPGAWNRVLKGENATDKGTEV